MLIVSSKYPKLDFLSLPKSGVNMKVLHLVVALAFAALAIELASAQNAPSITLVNITPSAEDISTQFPTPSDVKMVSFYFRGTLGTRYSAVFAADAEPASVIGVGANIDATSFDTSAKQLTVSFVFDRPVIGEEGKPVPNTEFQLIIDPGAARDFTPIPRPSGGFAPPPRNNGASTSATSECYGPANKTPRAPGELGPPVQGAGTFMSTNIASWCEIPPSAESPYFGFRFIAPSGTSGYVKKKIAPGLLALLSSLVGKTLDATNIAVFNTGFEASKSVVATPDGGVLITLTFDFLQTATRLKDAVSATTKQTGVKSTASVSKTILTAEEEAISLSPTDTKVTTAKTTLYGFIANDALGTAKSISIQRKSGSKITTIGKATINSDGSYTKSISSTTLFANQSRATLLATLVGNAARASREVSLQNKTRNSRR